MKLCLKYSRLFFFRTRCIYSTFTILLWSRHTLVSGGAHKTLQAFRGWGMEYTSYICINTVSCSVVIMVMKMITFLCLRTGWLVGSGLMALLAQKSYIVPRTIQNWWYRLISLMNEIRDFWGDNLRDIRKIKVLVIFVSNGLIMRAVC